ncbi:MAG TPA: histidine phosphatase family protein [Elusimicrobiota bacterium]|nr:histidine phosphatase family protein [Elusimicrobiota bacterium]
MELCLIRHGQAAETAGNGRDADRPLTESGRDDVGRMARHLVRQGWSPEIMLTSPYLRAVQTADIIHGILKKAPPRPVPFLSVDSSVRNIVKGLEDFGGCRSLLLVGHQPSLGQAAGHFLMKGISSFPLTPGSSCRILLPDGIAFSDGAGRGSLITFLSPEEIDPSPGRG